MPVSYTHLRISCLLGVVSFVDARDDLDSLDEEDASCCLMANRAGGLRFGLSEEKSNSISVLSNNDDPNKHYQNQLLERDVYKRQQQLSGSLRTRCVL